MLTVEEIVKTIIAMPPEKRDEVRRRLAQLWSMSDLPELASNNVIPDRSYRKHWPGYTHSPMTTRRARPRRPPIQIKGKPISETVVEDRR